MLQFTILTQNSCRYSYEAGQGYQLSFYSGPLRFPQVRASSPFLIERTPDVFPSSSSHVCRACHYSNRKLSPPTPFVSAACLAAETRLVQTSPVLVAIVDCDFSSRLNALADKNHALGVQPDEVRCLRVGFATMVCEASVIAHPPLPDLIFSLWCRPFHHIKVSHTICDQSH